MKSCKKYLYLNLFFIFTLFFSELCLMYFTTGHFENTKSVFFFSFSIGTVLTFITALIGRKALFRIVTLLLLIIIYVSFVTEILLFRSFGFFYPPETVFNMASDVIGSYSGGIIQTALSGIFPVILLFLPISLFSGFRKHVSVGYVKKSGLWLLAFVLGVGVHFLTVATLSEGENGEISDKDYHGASFDFNEGVKRFGLAESMRLNLVYSVSEIPSNDIKNIEIKEKNTENGLIMTNYNKKDIDFDKIKNSTSDKKVIGLCDYFMGVAPSEKNEYTGVFKGKNLIFICAEAFSPYAVSEERTPTLYKLINGGFVFSDYYQASFGESTSGGEYSLLLGQVPKKDSGEKGMSMRLACEENLRYSLPALFKKKGYITNGFHNNSFTYYGRDVTHPKMNMNWYGCYGCTTNDGSQLDLSTLLSAGWPRLDSELITKTVDRYIYADKPFFTYYLTVSGHNNYSFEENTAARKNKDMVSSLKYSERVKSYLAAQYELEKALTELIAALTAAGKLSETVIALSNDHYPYGLAPLWQGNGGRDYISELYGKEVETTVEREKGAFFIWCSDMKGAVRVEKPTSSFDVLPTLLNLFGIDFDSRILAGRDALSNEIGLAFFSDYSWKTEFAQYDAGSGKITKFRPVADEYIKEIHGEVKNRIQYSKMLRQKNFFKFLKDYV